MFCGVRRYLFMFEVDDFVITVNIGNEFYFIHMETCIIIMFTFFV